MQKFGIDISRHNGNFDLKKAQQEGVEFVILKGAGGDAGLYKDAKFESNYLACKSLGLPVGAYFYSRALTEAKAVEEAEYFYKNCLKDKQFELPVYIDVEESAQFALGRDKLTAVVKTFCETLENKGFFVGIYSNKYGFSTYMNDSELLRFSHWVAAWNTIRPDADMWQFGGETNAIRSNKVAGTVCDQNYLYTDFESVIRKRGLNGFTKEEAAPPVSGKTVYRVQVGAFAEKKNAEAFSAELKEKGYDSVIVTNVPGDIDGDGVLTAEDARTVLRRSVGLP